MVRRARPLLGADMTYLSLNDEVEGAFYMKVTDGALTRMILKALVIGAIVHFITIPLVGALSDRIGRRPLYLIGAVGVAAWSWIFFAKETAKSSLRHDRVLPDAH